MTQLLDNLLLDNLPVSKLEEPHKVQPYVIINRASTQGVLVLCDHATPLIPPEYQNLGLSRADLGRHINYDIGAAGVAQAMADELSACAIVSNFSRLLIDPNRGLDDPTLIMRIADGLVIPGNAKITKQDRLNRIKRFYEPYHQAITNLIDHAIEAGHPPVLFSVHTFSPVFRNIKRHLHAGVLWDNDPRLARPLIDGLTRTFANLKIGDNRPYDGALRYDGMYRHGTMRGLAHAVIEIRQDLVCDPKDARNWGSKMAEIFSTIKKTDPLDKIHFFGSRND